MSAWVVDASVVVKWLVPEEHSEEAILLRSPRLTLHAPELVLPEVGNVLWKKARRGEMSGAEAEAAAHLLIEAPLILHSHLPLAAIAVKLASEFDRSVYDSTYLALAAALETRVITADGRLYRALAGTPLRTLLHWVGDLEDMTRD